MAVFVSRSCSITAAFLAWWVRPGLSASLIAVNMFAGGALGAGVFGLGTAMGGYAMAAVISGLGGVAGAGLLVALERGRG